MGSLGKSFLRGARTVCTLSLWGEFHKPSQAVRKHNIFANSNKQNLNVALFSVRHNSTYRAAVLNEVGQPLVVKSLARKSLKRGDVRIGVYCCGINSIDQLAVYGGLEIPPTLPIVPGYEVCGEILEVNGDVDDCYSLKGGQRVIAMHPDFQGGFAEEMVISAKDVWPVNDSLSFEIGATLVNSYTTALLALSRRAEVKKGDSVLITGAGGRLGLAAVDLAANVYRCKVIALCGDDEKAAAVRERGAFATIIEGKKDLVAEVKRANDGKRVKIIIDPVGGDVFKRAVQCLEEEGKVVVTGYASKRMPQIGAEELLENSVSVIGVSLDQYRKKQLDVFREAITEVIEMADENLIKPYKAKHFSLEQVNDALEDLKDPKAFGKYVIDIK